MSRVLCAWEFGGDLGHIRRLMPIARELRATGHEVSFALRDNFHLDAPMSEGFEAFVAPRLRAPARPNPWPLSFAEVLLNLGFDDRAALAGAVRAWRSLYELLLPDIVVAEYAPTALLAARAMNLPRVTLGAGFSVPVLGDPLPALRAWIPAQEGVLRALDDRVVSAMIAAAKLPEAQSPRHARELFDARAHLVCTFPEIDPFGPREGVEYLGPQGDASSGADVRWASGARARVFAYLKPRDPRYESIVKGLAELDAEVIVAAPGLAPAQAQAASRPGLRVLDGPVKLDTMLGEASLCVSHAGAGLAARALVAGVPMALLPTQLEQTLIARRLQDGGSAEISSPDNSSRGFGSWFASLLARGDLREAARARVQAHRGHSFEVATQAAARRIVESARVA